MERGDTRGHRGVEIRALPTPAVRLPLLPADAETTRAALQRLDDLVAVPR